MFQIAGNIALVLIREGRRFFCSLGTIDQEAHGNAEIFGNSLKHLRTGGISVFLPVGHRRFVEADFLGGSAWRNALFRAQPGIPVIKHKKYPRCFS